MMREREEVESDQEDDVVDYSHPRYDNSASVRISNGFNIGDLNEGVVFNPEAVDDNNNDENYRYYRDYIQEANENEMDEDFDTMKASMIDITPNKDGGVLKRTDTEGLRLQGHGLVPEKAVVKIHYKLCLEGQDEPFDSSIQRGKAEKHRMEDGSLIVGLQLGIRSMRKGEIAYFMIDHSYGYGELGCPPRVPGRAQILAKVEVMDFTEESLAEGMLGIAVEERKKKFTFTEIEKAARLENSNGNHAVRQKEFSLALRHYERGRNLIEDVNLADEEEDRRCKKLLVKLLLNIAHCANKLHQPRKACLACKDALLIEESAKALYRFGIAKKQLEDYEASRQLLLKAQKKVPNDPDVSRELRLLEDHMIQERKKAAVMCQRMFKEEEKSSEKTKANTEMSTEKKKAPSETSEEKKKANSEMYDLILGELEDFKLREEEEIFSFAEHSLSVKDLKNIRQAAGELGLETELVEGRGLVRVNVKRK